MLHTTAPVCTSCNHIRCDPDHTRNQAAAELVAWPAGPMGAGGGRQGPPHLSTESTHLHTCTRTARNCIAHRPHNQVCSAVHILTKKCELRITKVLQTRPAVLRPLSCSILRCGTSPFATMHNVTLLAIKDRKSKKVILYKTGFVVCSRGPALALERQKRSGNNLASCMCCCGCGHSLPCGICCGNQLSSCTYSSNSLPNCIFCRQSFPWA